MKVVRSPSVELLRCMAMGLIVADHCFLHGIFSGIRATWTLFFTAFVCWHVDAFLAISGWFGIKLSWTKYVKFCGLILFYNVLSWIYGGRSITAGWYGNNYLVLMLIAPAINRALEKMNARQAWIAWSVFAAGIVAYWLRGTRRSQ